MADKDQKTTTTFGDPPAGYDPAKAGEEFDARSGREALSTEPPRCSATLQDFVGWMKRDLGRFADLPVYIEAAGHGGHGVGAAATEQFVHMRIYTATNRYRFRAVERSDDEGYLSCQGSGRKPRAGANYTGGRDLHDGPLTEETWARILAEIVSYEMVRVQRNAVGSHLLGVPLRFWRSPPAGTRDDDRI